MADRVTELERENRKLKKRLEQAETIIEFQKKVSEVLGIPLKSPESGESDS
jgi:transposase